MAHLLVMSSLLFINTIFPSLFYEKLYAFHMVSKPTVVPWGAFHITYIITTFNVVVAWPRAAPTQVTDNMEFILVIISLSL